MKILFKLIIKSKKKRLVELKMYFRAIYKKGSTRLDERLAQETSTLAFGGILQHATNVPTNPEETFSGRLMGEGRRENWGTTNGRLNTSINGTPMYVVASSTDATNHLLNWASLPDYFEHKLAACKIIEHFGSPAEIENDLLTFFQFSRLRLRYCTKGLHIINSRKSRHVV